MALALHGSQNENLQKQDGLGMNDRMRKVFFALWPEEDLRSQLVKLQEPIQKGRKVPVESLHLTLHFVGQVESIDCLLEEAEKIHFLPGSIKLEDYGVFEKARVLWAGPIQWSKEIVELSSACRETAKTCGYPAHTERFRPHVTLARKVSRLPELPAFKPVQWEFHTFSLVESNSTDHGVSYRVLRTFSGK
ncbi:MAG TPA: RNA 2',3'-cyclic phosphodiesterase [Chromatiales bacterium]|nr:RNA 2',3'-cyclic phosphodiesterase [Thiotrichales bacterium]HIP67954.1 RNA 2',3'-cyclic phosphodiesterase [Chromatiales bacterium]